MSVYTLIVTFLVCLKAEASNDTGWVFPSEEVSLHCRTKDGQNGTCKEIEYCPSALEAMAKETPTRCHFENSQPVVCCVDLDAISEPPTTTVDPSTTDESSEGGASTESTTEVESTESSESSDAFVDSCGIRPTFFSRTEDYTVRKRRSVAGGFESVAYSWPWMVAIMRVSPIGTSRFLCGGSLLNARHVITAAHCFEEDLPASRYKVLVGLHVKTEGTLYNVEEVLVHEDYVPTQGYNDIAMVKLSEDVLKSEKIGAVCLPESSSESTPGKMTTVTGWGDTSFGGTRSDVLREAQIPIVSNDACNNSYFRPDATRFKQGIIQSQLCAGLSEGGKDACQGDSGGPLMLETGNNRWSVVGIVSFGVRCAEPGFPGVYTRVKPYLPWIKNKSKITPP